MKQIERYLDAHFISVRSLCTVLSRFVEPGKDLDAYVDDHLHKYGRVVGSDIGKRNRLRSGEITIEDMTYLLFEEQNRAGIPIQNNATFISGVIDKLRLFMAVTEPVAGAQKAFQLNRDRFSALRDFGLLEHLIFGPAYSIKRLQASIPYIETTDSAGDRAIGTGLVVATGADEKSHSRFILTNRHVVEDKRIEQIRSLDRNFALLGEPILCEFADLAAMEIARDVPVQSFLLNPDPDVLSEVVALGYPAVARSIEPVLLAHRGEINGEIETTDRKKLLVVSCHVNPGNSGGPLIDEIGRCCGMVTQSHSTVFEARSIAGGTAVATYNMAIPGKTIDRFIQEKCGGPMRAQPSVLKE